jgi:hypothetical protein
MPISALSPGTAAAMVALALDAATAEVVQALRRERIRAVLLKGPALARLLYDSASERPYGDIDLLVDPREEQRAERVLMALGFAPPPDYVHQRPPHASSWRRGRDRVSIDLHRSLVGVGGPPQAVWKTLAADTDAMRVAGASVEVLNDSATAFQVALHAAQHGARIGKPLEDLTRALERFPEHTWTAAARMAEEMDAVPAFATGLRLVPVGAALADRLGLSRTRPPDVALRATTPPPVSRGFARLERTPGFSAKAVLVARELVPEVDFMRRSSRLARRGRLGLALAYAWRPWWLLWHAGPGLRAWRSAKKDAKSEK